MPLDAGRVARPQCAEYARQIGPVAIENIAWRRGLEIANPDRIQVVEAHPGQRVVDRSEHGMAGRRQEIQPVHLGEGREVA